MYHLLYNMPNLSFKAFNGMLSALEICCKVNPLILYENKVSAGIVISAANIFASRSSLFTEK